MKKYFQKIIQRLRMFFFALKTIIKSSVWSIKIDSNIKSAYFNLKVKETDRHLFLFIITLAENNYKVFIKPNFWFIGSLIGYKTHKPYSNKLFDNKNIKILLKNNKQNIFNYYFSDTKTLTKKRKVLAKKYFTLNYDFFTKIKEQDNKYLFFPFPTHPEIIINRWNSNQEILRSHKRRFKVLFMGGATQNEELNITLSSTFNMLPRFKIISIINNELPDNIKYKIRIQKQLDSDNGYHNKLVIPDTLKLRIPQKRWLHTLALTDFFLALPGVKMPLSHNIIECMSVGTIPITEYPEYFSPPLRSGINCITYKGQDSFIKAIYEVINMDHEEIKKIKKNVIEYYDMHLDPKAFCEKLNYYSGDKIILNTGGLSISLFKRSNK